MAHNADWRFLFREERGEIDAPDWRRGAAILAVLMLAMTGIWWLLLPYANRDLSERKLLDPMVFLAYAYLLVFVLAIFLAAVSCYFLSAKRWRDLGRPSWLAGLPLIAALVAGAAAWLQPRVSEVMPWAIVGALNIVLVAIIIWHVWQLGFVHRAR